MCQVEQNSNCMRDQFRQVFKRFGCRIVMGDTMTSNGKAWLMALVMGIMLPGLLFSVSEKLLTPVENQTLTEDTTNATFQTESIEVQQTSGYDVLVLTADNAVTKMDMGVYLAGVLLAEMPTDFDIEALKAQAVVARTYALRSNTFGKKHAQGAVCINSGCCQSYRSTEDYLANGGSMVGLQKVKTAVENTESQVLEYNGTLIEATYFSCSGGRTEDALAVWGTDIPYLQAVDSPGEENATHYTDTVQLKVSEFATLLGISPKAVSSAWLGYVTYTEGGGVDTMIIDGKKFTGVEVRQKLGLRSTAFTMLVVGDTIHISTRGYGHRVGMSQYGAEAMAVNGSNYKEILYHYYPGTTLAAHTRN